MTTQAKRRIRQSIIGYDNVNLILYDQYKMETVSEIVESVIPDEGKREKFINRIENVYPLYRSILWNQTLTYFQHKMADLVSVFRSVPEGAVPTLGIEVKDVPFIQKTREPYTAHCHVQKLCDKLMHYSKSNQFQIDFLSLFHAFSLF